MYRYKNKLRSPVQVIVRSRVEVAGSGSRSFTTLNIPGVGAGNNECLIEDERHVTDVNGGNVDRLMKAEIISVQYVPNRTRKEE